MEESSRQRFLTQLLCERYFNQLRLISEGNEEVVASLLAGVLSFSERKNQQETPQDQLASVCELALDILQSKLDFTEFNHNSPIVRHAIIRYHKMVVPGLRGRQTPRIENARSESSNSSKFVTGPDSPKAFNKVMRFFAFISLNQLFYQLISSKSKRGS